MKKRNVSILVLLAISIAVLGIVYALQQYTFYSPKVTYGAIEGKTQLSIDGENWAYNNITVLEGSSWFARFVTEEGYKGNVTLTWTLQKYVDGVWIDQDITKKTSAILSGEDGQLVYCAYEGHHIGNFDWGSVTSSERGDQFRIKVEFSAYEGVLP